MGGKSTSGSTTTQSQTQDQTGHSTTSGYAPAMDIISSLMPGLQSAATNGTQVTPAQTGALNTLQTNAANTESFAPQTRQLATDMIGGDDFQRLRAQLNPYTQADYLNPMSNPGMQGILDTIRQDVGNSVNGQFAGAGRDLSGINQQQLARGIAQGEAPALFGQYNTNVSQATDAAKTLFAGSQQNNTNRAQGLNLGIDGLPAAQNAPAMNVLNASTLQQQFPLQNFGAYSSLLGSLAGLGQTTDSTGHSTGTGTSNTNAFQQASPMQTALGWSGVFKNLGFGFGGGKK